ncbi:hypothetical protein FSARC_11249, partial [Fusarium sarcochroum]
MATGVDARLMKSTKFPPEFSQKVDMQKVNLQVMKKWIASKISDILGSEDDVVIELVFNLIEGPRYPDIKSLQIQLTGFLDKDTAAFCKDLWKLLLSAQSSPQGVPKELLEAKKLELMQEKIEADRAAESAKQRQDDWDRRDREVVDLKDRDRRDRAAARGDTWQGRRGGRDFDDNRGRGGFRRGGGRIHSGAIVMSREADAVEAGLTMVEENHLLRHVQRRHRLDRARGAVVRHAAPINRTGGGDQYPQGSRETGERDRDRLKEIHTGVRQIAVVKEVAPTVRLGPFLQTDILPHPNEDILAAEAEAAVIAAVAAAQAVRHLSEELKGGKVPDEVVRGLREGENRPKVGDGIVLQLLRDPGLETSQLMFLKMNLVPRRPNPRQRWLPDEISE